MDVISTITCDFDRELHRRQAAIRSPDLVVPYVQS